jgi:hypothetical protein
VSITQVAEEAMSNSGVGMVLGHLSVDMFYLLAVGIIILGAVVLYAVIKAGNLRRSERARLDSSTQATQAREDPQKQ